MQIRNWSLILHKWVEKSQSNSAEGEDMDVRDMGNVKWVVLGELKNWQSLLQILNGKRLRFNQGANISEKWNSHVWIKKKKQMDSNISKPEDKNSVQ